MAFSVSSHSLFTPLPLVPPPKPSKILLTLKPQQSLRPTLRRAHLFGGPLSQSPLSHCSPLPNARRSFTSFFAAHDSNPIKNCEGEDSNNGASEKEAASTKLSSLNAIFKSYKDAILEADEKSITDLEAMIFMVENDKNDLVQKVSALSADITAGKEKYIRLQADFDNFRKRSEKERLNARTDAKIEVIESLLQMVDNFERAKQQLKPETEKERKIDTSYQGIYKQFVEIMRSLHVSAVPTIGKPFDPALHEAIAREESQEFKEGVVTQECLRGFLIGERLLRPAMVKVSSGPGPKKNQTTTSTGNSIEQPVAAGADER